MLLKCALLNLMDASTGGCKTVGSTVGQCIDVRANGQMAGMAGISTFSQIQTMVFSQEMKPKPFVVSV